MREQLLERFLRYVRINTSSDENSETIPSTQHQFDLAHVLENEMKELGIQDVYVDEHCYVYGKLPATAGYEELPAIAFIAHMDTVSDFCAAQVNPIVHENYQGGDIELGDSGRVLSPREFKNLDLLKGRTIITSDGTTILGADDKAGIAEIMTMAEELITSDDAHGTICFAFTSDEEIGSGAELLDLERLGATAAYTMDGGEEGTIEYENFNAASAKVHVTGVNVHPGDAKDIMINAGAVACEFQSMLPEQEQPCHTEGYEGFFHMNAMSGTVESADLSYIIRDHDRTHFEARKAKMLKIADVLNQKYKEGTVTVSMKDSYYNMKEIIDDHMELIENAKKAIEQIGLTPVVSPIRGGTDGARLSFRGLPCPNLGTGGYGYHGPYEHISLEGMEAAVNIIYQLARA